MILSSQASSTIEEVAESSQGGLKLLQLNISPYEKETVSLIRRAEREGYKALAVSVDSPYLGRGHVTDHPLKLPPHIKYANLPWFMDDFKNQKSNVTEVSPKKLAEFNWELINWLRLVKCFISFSQNLFILISSLIK